VPPGALPGLPSPAGWPHPPAAVRVLGWASTMLAAAAMLGAHHRLAAAGAVGAVLLVGSVRLGFPWAGALAVAAAVVADAFVVRYLQLGWDPRIDPYVVALVLVVATLGALLAWLRVVPLTVAAVCTTAGWLRDHLPGGDDPDSRPSPRPFNDDERLWEHELSNH
jgi:hypothetical protein